MTGGIGGVEGRAHRWEEKQLDQLRTRREDVQKELASLARETRKTTQLANLDSQIKGCEIRLETAKADRAMTLEKLHHTENEIKVCLVSSSPSLDSFPDN